MGIPYLYDRKDIFYNEDNRYQLTKDGIEYIVHAHLMKTNISLFSTNQMKRLVNASKNYVLMIVKEKDVEQTGYFNIVIQNLKRT